MAKNKKELAIIPLGKIKHFGAAQVVEFEDCGGKYSFIEVPTEGDSVGEIGIGTGSDIVWINHVQAAGLIAYLQNVLETGRLE